MEELILAIRQGNLSSETLESLRNNRKDYGEIEKYYKEFNELERSYRDTQIGQTQQDKTIKDENGNSRPKKAIRIPASYQNKIVRTGVAFEFGEPVTLMPSEDNDLTKEIERLWDVNRIDSKIQKLKIIQRSETQAALVFYTQSVDKDNTINKKLGDNKDLEIKCKVINFKNGDFYPVFDSFGDMKMFVWEFKTKEGKKDVANIWIYDSLNKTMFKDKVFVESKPHNFMKIPVVYFSQEKPEYYEVQAIIDRLETSMSKLAASNNYSGHPLLFTVGEVTGMPDRDADGKMLNAPIDARENEDGKPIHGDAKFLTHDNAPESVRLELDKLKDMIYSLTSTPDLSFNNLKGIGNVSGVALKLLFLDSILKAKLNEGENRTDVQRIVNILISGVINITNIKLKNQAQNLYYNVKFGNILPDDLETAVNTLTTAVSGGIMSKETAIDKLALVDDTQEELEKIKSDSQPKNEQ